jgi:hypothetical protein
VREIKELQFELREMEGDVRSMRARMIRIVDELERNYVTKADAKRLMAAGTPTLPSYLLETLELLQAGDLMGVEQTLHVAARLTDDTLSQILATGDDVTEPEPLEPASLDPEPLEPSEPPELES